MKFLHLNSRIFCAKIPQYLICNNCTGQINFLLCIDYLPEHALVADSLARSGRYCDATAGSDCRGERTGQAFDTDLWERTFVELLASGHTMWGELNSFHIRSPCEGFSDRSWSHGTSGISRNLHSKPQYQVKFSPRSRVLLSYINIYVEICVFFKGDRLE